MKYVILFIPFIGIFAPHLIRDFEKINTTLLKVSLVYQLFIIGLIFTLKQ